MNDLNIIINLLANSKGMETGYKAAAAQQVALNREMNRGQAAAVNMSKGMNTATQQSSALGNTLRSTAGVAATFFGLFAAQSAAISIKDQLGEYQDFRTRLQFLSGDTQTYTENLTFLDNLSQRHGKSILELGNGYTNLAALQRGNIVTLRESQQLTEGLSNAASALGADNSQLSLVYYGLSQALSQPKVQAQELNQVVEPLPGLLQELTKAAGLQDKSFRDLVISGEVTSELFRNTLLKALSSYDGAAQKNINNIKAQETALVNLRVKAVSAFEKPINNVYSELLKTTGNGFEFLSENAETVTSTLEVLITAGLIRGTVALGNYTAAVGSSISANINKVASDKAAALAAVQTAKAEQQKALSVQAAAHRQLAAAKTDGARTTAIRALAIANGQAAAAQNAVTAATVLYTKAASVATVAARGLMAVVGGIPGLLLLGGFALYSYASSADEASTSTNTLRDRVYDLTDAYNGLNNATVRNDILRNTREALLLSDQITELTKRRQVLFNQRDNTSDPRSYKRYSQQIDFLTGSINQLASQRGELLNTNVKLANTEENLNNLDWKSVDDQIGRAEELNKLREDQEKHGNTLLQNMERQIALYGDTSNEASIRYEIESGKLTVINEQLREKLILEAKELDNLQKQRNFQNKFERLAATLKTPEQAEVSRNKDNLSLLNEAKASTPETDLENRQRINQLILAEQQRHQTAMNEITRKGRDDFDALWDESFDRFASGIGQATSEALFESQNLGEGIRNVVLGVGKQMVATLVEIGVKRLLLASINQTATVAEAATATTAGVSTGASITAAMTPAAAATSIATAGSNGVGAVAAIGAVAAAMAAMFAGFFDNGGYIPAGQFGIAGEKGPEIINGPARITSRTDTARIFKKQGSSQANNSSSVVVHIYDNKQITMNTQAENDHGELKELLEQNNKHLEYKIADGISKGKGAVYGAIRRYAR